MGQAGTCGARGSMSELEQGVAQAATTIAALRSALAANGLNSVESPPNPIGAGLGVAWGEDVFMVITVEAGEPNMVNLGSAVLRDVAQERGAICAITNQLTMENPLMPVVLHDAEAGWDVIAMQRFPYQLLMDNQQFMCSCALALAHRSKEMAERFGPFGGRRPQWTMQEVHEMVIRTTL
jgi:hypothetical protein